MRPERAVAITHSDTDVLGSLPDLFSDLGVQLEVIPVSAGLPDPDSLGLAVVMGSPESAYDHRLPWLANELTWLQSVQARGVPTLGICFGSQLLARALGGQVYRNAVPEIGWTPLETPDGWAHKGPWLNFHFDAFTPPPGSTLLGLTDLAPQAYRKGRAMGVQFHPEIDTEMFDTWTAYWHGTEEGKRFLASAGDLPERMRAEIQAREPENQANCKALLRDFLNNI
ncbi:type 1 glutamine amidotransferase [Pseudomonas boanensis]|uniref:type 1 glutamine amidotransferase n=1 Tax=Metapseudomonas boanensis TaxID=2822138 RepID=UPI0035D3F100